MLKGRILMSKDGFTIEHFNFYPGDTLLVHYTKETDVEEMR